MREGGAGAGAMACVFVLGNVLRLLSFMAPIAAGTDVAPAEVAVSVAVD